MLTKGSQVLCRFCCEQFSYIVCMMMPLLPRIPCRHKGTQKLPFFSHTKKTQQDYIPRTMFSSFDYAKKKTYYFILFSSLYPYVLCPPVVASSFSVWIHCSAQIICAAVPSKPYIALAWNNIFLLCVEDGTKHAPQQKVA